MQNKLILPQTTIFHSHTTLFHLRTAHSQQNKNRENIPSQQNRTLFRPKTSISAKPTLFSPKYKRHLLRTKHNAFWIKNSPFSSTSLSYQRKKDFSNRERLSFIKKCLFLAFSPKNDIFIQKQPFLWQKGHFWQKTAIFCHKIHVNGLKWVKRFDIQLCHVGQNM